MPTWLTRERLIVLGVFAVLFYFARSSINLGWSTLWYIVVLIPSIILHEVSHGWLANKFGDPTARLAGRLNLNPVKHIDPFGTVILPLILTVVGAPAFGYAKPVPVNTSRMSRNKAMFVGLVGPFTNIVLSFVVLGLLVAAFQAGAPLGVLEVIFTAGIVNVVLAVFNLLPIPPLDGSSVVERFLPARYLRGYYVLRQFSVWILLIFVIAGQNVLGGIFEPFIQAWVHLADSLLPDRYYY